jgi:hypothetical protein
MNLKILTLLFCLISLSAFGQTEHNETRKIRNAIYVEALGSGLPKSSNNSQE